MIWTSATLTDVDLAAIAVCREKHWLTAAEIQASLELAEACNALPTKQSTAQKAVASKKA